MVKGIGKGIGGVILKPPAGMRTLCSTDSPFPWVTYSDSTASRSLGTFRISLGWTS